MSERQGQKTREKKVGGFDLVYSNDKGVVQEKHSEYSSFIGCFSEIKGEREIRRKTSKKEGE